MQGILEKLSDVHKIVGFKAILVFSLSKESTLFYESLGFRSYCHWAMGNNNIGIIVPDDGYNAGCEVLLLQYKMIK